METLYPLGGTPDLEQLVRVGLLAKSESAGRQQGNGRQATEKQIAKIWRYSTDTRLAIFAAASSCSAGMACE